MTLGLPEVTTHEQQCGTSSWYRKFRRLDDVRVNSPSTLADDAHVQVPALESPLDCKRSASIWLPQRCHRVPPKCTSMAQIWVATCISVEYGGTRVHNRGGS
jgi:hypothetical protein